MLITPSKAKLPFKLQCRQFPLAICFVTTIDKSKGQTLSPIGLYLPKLVFRHGQLYIAISRVTSKKGLKTLIIDKKDNPINSILNVVYKED